MARRRDPVSGKLLIEGVHPVVSERTGVVTYRARCEYRDGPKRKHVSKVFKRADDAVAWKMETDLRLNRGDTVDSSRMTVSTYFAAWFSRKAQHWSGSRQRGVTSSWQRYIEPEIGHLPLQSVTRRHIQRLVDKMTAAGCSTRTARIYMVSVRALFRAAVIDELILRNPCHDLEYPPEEVQKRPTWSVLELRRYIGHLQTSESPYRPVLMFIAGTGCRIGEALALHWEDVSLDAGTVWIHRTLSSNHRGRFYIENRTKTGSDGREIPIPEWLQEELRRHEGDSGMVWHNNGNIILPNYVRDEHYAIIEQLGITKIRVHDIRHTVGSLLHASGVDHQTIQEYLGHEDANQTRQYIHPQMSKLKSGVSAISRILGFEASTTTTKSEKDALFEGNASQLRQN